MNTAFYGKLRENQIDLRFSLYIFYSLKNILKNGIIMYIIIVIINYRIGGKILYD